jgi:F-type H+-transporting ATPase subunit delta
VYNKKVSRRYSTALYEIASGNKITDALRNDCKLLIKIIEESKELKQFFQTPIINAGKKREVFKKIFDKKVNDLTLKFFDLLTEKKRENYLYDIASDFLNLLNEKEGIIQANIKTAVKISDDDKINLSAKLKDFTGKRIEANYSIDPSLKGGFIAQIDDTIIDGSIQRQLELLYNKFKKGSFTSN